jgi:hypothetical protein
MFVHIPHVLVAGPIDVSDLEPLRWIPNPNPAEVGAAPSVPD